MVRFEGHKTHCGIGVVLRLFDSREAARSACGKDCAVIGIGPGFAYLGEGGAYFDEQGEIPDWWALDESLRNHDGEPDATHFRPGDWWVSPKGTRYLVTVETKFIHKDRWAIGMQVALRSAGRGVKKWRFDDDILNGWTREAWGGGK